MKALKRFITRLVQGAAVLVVIMAMRAAFAAETEAQKRPDLAGVVQDQNSQPLAGATVFIYTAGPKDGPGILCPSCYADCRKRVTTDADGKFIITSLDPDLVFRILVVGKDFQPKFVSKVDPAAKAITVKLKPQKGGEKPNEHLRGIVVDSDGKPVSGAVVSIRGVTRGESTRFGGNDDIDPLAVSDSEGKFTITGTNSFDSAGVDVEARGFAKAVFQSLATGDTEHTLKLMEGATIKGRVVKDGKPLGGVVVGVSGADRNAETYVGDFSVGTDKEGNFLIANLPPRVAYVLYGTMESLKARGSIPAQNIKMADNGATLNMGDVEVKPGFVLAGQVRLSDGKPVPPKTRVLLGREGAWDTWQAIVDDTGHFRFEGVPPEEVSLSARANNYHLSAHNASLDLLNPFSMVGRIVANKTDLIVELEPGKDLQPQRGDYQAMEALHGQPLRGAEAAGEPNPADIKVTGTVVDAETQKPISLFTVTEGLAGGFDNQISWLISRKNAQSNGTFTVYLANSAYLPTSGRSQPSAVLIEAEGYFPQASGPIGSGGTNLTVALKKGSAPSGVVLNPDGSPAADVKVYLTDMKNGVYVGDSDHLKIRDEIYRGTTGVLTDAKGHFTLPLKVDSFSVIALTDKGYANVRMAELEKNPEVRLQPFAHIDGKLMIGNRPGSNEIVRLGLVNNSYEFYPRNFSPMNLFLTTKTDDEGKFSFKEVPPVAVEVYHEPKVRDSNQGIIAQSQTTKFLLQPGETRHLELGGKGRPVVGRFVVTNYDSQINYRAEVQSIETVVPQPVEMPDMAEFMKTFSAKMRALTNDDEKKVAMEDYKKQSDTYQEKMRDYSQSEAGRKYFFAQRRFALNFSQDGSFRIEDVPGGKYNLRIELREDGDNPMNFNAPVIANYTKEIEVADSPNGVGEAQDLGTIQVGARKVLKTGTAAPDFNVKTLDGKPLKLSDFKGKYVLLDFWATWCGPCVGETPSLQAAWNAFKNDPRFVMVSLSLDPEADAPRSYAAKNKFDWYQGFLGDWSKSDVPATFGVEGIPAIFLIGPDGKIVARDLRGDAIKTAIADALQKK